MRKNPSREWYLEPKFLRNDENGLLINPNTNDIYWFHGMVGEPVVDYIRDLKESNTLYLSSSFETAKSFAQANNLEFFKGQPKLQPQVYEVLVEIPDVRYLMSEKQYTMKAIEI